MDLPHDHKFGCCWHDSDVVQTVNPPLMIQRCCWCGAGRSLVAVVPFVTLHGPYALQAPELPIGTLVSNVFTESAGKSKIRAS
jgi:hypothetical protein